MAAVVPPHSVPSVPSLMAQRPARRPGSHWASWKGTGSHLFTRINDSRVTGVAAELAFWLFLSLLPIAAVASFVAARFATSNADASARLFDAVPPAMRDLVAQQLTNVAAWNGGKVGFVAACTFVWMASSGVQSIFDAIELEVGSARPWWKKRLLAIGSCVALSVGIAIVGFLFTGAAAIAHFGGQALPSAIDSIGAQIFRVVATSLIGFLIIAGVFLVGVPPMARPRMAIVPGALVAVALEGALGLGYGLYIRATGTGDAYQGTLAVIGVTLMSLYLVAVALLIGVQVSLYVAARRIDRLRDKRDAMRTAQG